MKKTLKLAALGLLAAAVAAMPMQLLAQTTNKAKAKPAAENNSAPKAEKKTRGHPFHGKLAEVNKIAKTITVGKSTYQITSETRIKKGDKPATLDDGVVGEVASGYVKPNAEGKLIATTVTFGAKTATKSETKSDVKTEAKTGAKSDNKSPEPKPATPSKVQ